MSGNSNAHFPSCLFLNGGCHFIGNRRISTFLQFFLIFFLRKSSIFFGNSTFCYRNDSEAAALFISLFYFINHFVDVVRNLREQNDIRSACHTCVQSQPSHLVSHHFHNKDSSMRSSRRMNTINRIGRNVHCTLKTKGHISSPEVIINGFWQGNYIQSLFSQQISRLVRTVSAENYQTIQLKLIIILFHCLHFVETVLIRILYRLKRST